MAEGFTLKELANEGKSPWGRNHRWIRRSSVRVGLGVPCYSKSLWSSYHSKTCPVSNGSHSPSKWVWGKNRLDPFLQQSALTYLFKWVTPTPLALIYIKLHFPLRPPFSRPKHPKHLLELDKLNVPLEKGWCYHSNGRSNVHETDEVPSICAAVVLGVYTSNHGFASKHPFARLI